MLPISPLLALTSLYLSAVSAQIAEPPIPDQVVFDHAKHVLAAGSSDACEVACAQMASELPGQVHFNPSETRKLWAAQQAELTPACRVEPASAEEVSSILQILRDNRCHYAIKSGGHARFPGASNADRGATIDLGRMNSIEIAKDRKSVHVGGGCVWGDVYEAMEAEGLSVVGGRVADVGVGGVILGGGLSFWSNKYGWACDRVISYELVLPDGTITTVDQDHHPDLYKALRGAGFTNFGVVTSFQLETIVPPNPKGFWFDMPFRSWDQLPAWLDAYYEATVKGTAEDEDAAFIHVYAYDNAHDAHLLIEQLTHASHTDPSTNPKAFQAHANMTTLAPRDVQILPYSNITTIIYHLNPPAATKRSIYSAWTHRPSKAFQADLLPLCRATTDAAIRANITGLFPSYVMQPIYRRALARMAARGGNALNLAPEAPHGPLVSFSLSWTWDHPSDDARVAALVRDFDAAFRALAHTHAAYHPYKYVNYAEAWQEDDVWAGYGADNLRWLRAVQRRYDRDGLFARGGLATGYFKINSEGDTAGGAAPAAEEKPNESGIGSRNGDVKDEL